MRLVILIVLMLAVGCGGSGEEHADGQSSERDIDALRALPYISHTPDPVPEAERGTVVLDTTLSYPGYNICTTLDASMTEIVSARGELVRRWRGPPGLWRRATLLPNGNLLVVGEDRSAKRYAARLDWDNKLIWKVDLMTHHDIGLTPDGRIAVLTMAPRRVPAISNEFDIRDDRVTILTPAGEVVEYRSLYDVMSSRPDRFRFGQVGPEGGSIDLFHANSIRWMMNEALFDRHPIYAAGNAIVCMRHQDTVAIFDWERGELLWAWGQGEISGPHDVSVLDNGNLLIFDNGLDRGWSRVVELDPLKREIVWEYSAPKKHDFYTHGRGACQRLPNGNTVITESDMGRAFEVTPKGDIVWEYFNPHVDGDGRRATFIRLYRLELADVDRLLALEPRD